MQCGVVDLDMDPGAEGNVIGLLMLEVGLSVRLQQEQETHLSWSCCKGCKPCR